MKKEDIAKVIELSLVLAVTLSMLIYGLAKYAQFGGASSINGPVSDLSGMELMWAFYGYSVTYPILLGIAEVTGAVLLLIRKTRVLGGLLLTTILLNIIVQDIIYEVNQGALFAAIIYQLMIFGIFWFNRERVIAGFKTMLLGRNQEESTKKKILLIGAAIGLAIIWKVIEFALTHWI